MQDAVGCAFLKDPDGGADKVAERAGARELDSVKEELSRSARTIQSLESQITEAKTRLADESTRRRADITRQTTAAAASRASLEDAVRRLTMRIAELEAELEGRDTTEAGLRSEIDDLMGKLERSVVRARKRAQRDHVKARRPMSPPSDPVEFAAWLDSVERQQRSFRQARGKFDEVVQDYPPLRIPGGLLPGSHEALVALVNQMPDAIYIDGYNVGAMLTEDFATAKARTRVVAIAERLAVASGARVVVVFDAVGVDGRASAPTQGRAEVRFTHAQIADDEIVELVRDDPSRNAVITSDRELSDRCAAEGCVTVWSEALVQWATR
jgi:chaperonin cofactor prefoldin